MGRLINKIIIMSIICSTLYGSDIGIASYYADRFHGKTMANRKPFDMNAMTVAVRVIDGKPEYPFGTKLKVTNLKNGKSVVVVATDTGSFGRKYDRLIDLSKGAFAKLDKLGYGLLKVKIEEVKWIF